MSCIGGSTSLGTVPRMAWVLPESADLLRAPERQGLTGARATEWWFRGRHDRQIRGVVRAAAERGGNAAFPCRDEA